MKVMNNAVQFSFGERELGTGQVLCLTIRRETRELWQLGGTLRSCSVIHLEDDSLDLYPGRLIWVPKEGLLIENPTDADYDNSVAFRVESYDQRIIRSLQVKLPRRSFDGADQIELRIERIDPEHLPPAHLTTFDDWGEFNMEGILNKPCVWAARKIKGVDATDDRGMLCAHTWYRVSLRDQHYCPPLEERLHTLKENAPKIIAGSVGVGGVAWTLACLFLFGNDPRLFFMGLGFLTSGSGFVLACKNEPVRWLSALLGGVGGLFLMILGTTVMVDPGEMAIIFEPSTDEIVRRADSPPQGSSNIEFHGPNRHANAYRTDWSKVECEIGSSDDKNGTRGAITLSVEFKLDDTAGRSLVEHFPRGLTENNRAGRQFTSELCEVVRTSLPAAEILDKEIVTTSLSKALARHLTENKTGLRLPQGQLTLKQLTLEYEQPSGDS